MSVTIESSRAVKDFDIYKINPDGTPPREVYCHCAGCVIAESKRRMDGVRCEGQRSGYDHPIIWVPFSSGISSRILPSMAECVKQTNSRKPYGR